MSNPVSKARRSRAKDLRQGIESHREIPVSGKPRHKKPQKYKPWVVYTIMFRGEPWPIHRAATHAQAAAWVEKESRSGFRARHYIIEHERPKRKCESKNADKNGEPHG